MAFPIKKPDTDALARKVAALKKTGLTEAVHTALARELERERGSPSLVDFGVQFCGICAPRTIRRRATRPIRRSVTACMRRTPDVDRRLGADRALDR